MAGAVGIIANNSAMFDRLLEESGCTPEVVTPHLLAAPFFRRKYSAIVVPSGFAYGDQLTVLYALRACRSRILKFIRSGGAILVYGAGADLPDAYDWVPFQMRYLFGFLNGPVKEDGSDLVCIKDECSEVLTVDGTFALSDIGRSAGRELTAPLESCNPLIHLTLQDLPVMVEYRYGSGLLVLTTLHEYPSRKFLKYLTSSGSETLL